VLESHSGGGQPVDMGCSDNRISVAADFKRPQLVTDADDYIGFAIHV
jgi:hypothetical protein